MNFIQASNKLNCNDEWWLNSYPFLQQLSINSKMNVRASHILRTVHAKWIVDSVKIYTAILCMQAKKNTIRNKSCKSVFLWDRTALNIFYRASTLYDKTCSFIEIESINFCCIIQILLMDFLANPFESNNI